MQKESAIFYFNQGLTKVPVADITLGTMLSKMQESFEKKRDSAKSTDKDDVNSALQSNFNLQRLNQPDQTIGLNKLQRQFDAQQTFQEQFSQKTFALLTDNITSLDKLRFTLGDNLHKLLLAFNEWHPGGGWDLPRFGGRGGRRGGGGVGEKAPKTTKGGKFARAAGKFGRGILGVGGGLLSAGALGLGLMDDYETRNEPHSALDNAFSYGTNALAGAELGGLAGSAILPGVGTAIGAGIGAAGGLASTWAVKNWDDLKGGATSAVSAVGSGLETAGSALAGVGSSIASWFTGPKGAISVVGDKIDTAVKGIKEDGPASTLFKAWVAEQLKVLAALIGKKPEGAFKDISGLASDIPGMSAALGGSSRQMTGPLGSGGGRGVFGGPGSGSPIPTGRQSGRFGTGLLGSGGRRGTSKPLSSVPSNVSPVYTPEGLYTKPSPTAPLTIGTKNNNFNLGGAADIGDKPTTKYSSQPTPLMTIGPSGKDPSFTTHGGALPKITGSPIPQSYARTGPAADGSRLGDLSARYEGKIGTTGGDGGRAYGKYQFDATKGGLQTFLGDNPEYAKQFQGLTPMTPAFNAKWREIAKNEPEKFEAAQDKSAQKIWYNPARQHAESLGFKTDNYGVQQAIFSGSIQHGKIKQILSETARNTPNFANLSPQDQIKAFYRQRTEYVRGLPGVPSQDRRYQMEERDALEYANIKPEATQTTQSNQATAKPSSPDLSAPGRAYDTLKSFEGFTPRGKDGKSLSQDEAIKRFVSGEGRTLDPTTQSWCAAIGGAAIHSAGIKDQPQLPQGSSDPNLNNNLATNYNKWGRGVDATKEKVQKGDVITFDEGADRTPEGKDYRRGHFGLLSGQTRVNERTGETEYEYTSGNTSDPQGRGKGTTVATKWTTKQPNVQFRRATEEMLPRLPDSATAAPKPESDVSSDVKNEATAIPKSIDRPPEDIQSTSAAEVTNTRKEIVPGSGGGRGVFSGHPGKISVAPDDLEKNDVQTKVSPVVTPETNPVKAADVTTSKEQPKPVIPDEHGTAAQEKQSSKQPVSLNDIPTSTSHGPLNLLNSASV